MLRSKWEKNKSSFALSLILGNIGMMHSKPWLTKVMTHLLLETKTYLIRGMRKSGNDSQPESLAYADVIPERNHYKSWLFWLDSIAF